MAFDAVHAAVSSSLDDTSALMNQEALMSEGWFEQFIERSSNNLMAISQYPYWWELVQVIALLMISIVAIFLMR